MNVTNKSSAFFGDPFDEKIFEILSFKTHRVDDFTFASPNTWTDIEFDLKITDECIGEIDYYNAGEVDEDKSIIVIKDSDRIFHVNGCTHPEFTGAGNATVIVASRVMFSYDKGLNWTEARCLQSNTELIRQANEVSTQHYLGTIKSDGETWLKLQARVSNTDMIFSGWATFDNPVAATMTVTTI